MVLHSLSTSVVPTFYRIFFTWLDPLICAWAAYMDFFDARLVLSSHVLNPTPDIGHIMILKQRGGAMLNIGFVSAVLLRYTQDLHIWNIIQIAVFIIDVTHFWSMYEVLEVQGRLNVSTWRKEDWGAIVITVTAGLVRVAFLASIGMKSVGKSQKNQR